MTRFCVKQPCDNLFVLSLMSPVGIVTVEDNGQFALQCVTCACLMRSSLPRDGRVWHMLSLCSR